MNIEDMRHSAESACAMLKSLSHPHRLMIVCALIEGERSVGELAKIVGLRDAAVSQQLALLRKDGILTTRREGQVIWYRVHDSAARELIDLLHRLYCKEDCSNDD